MLKKNLHLYFLPIILIVFFFNQCKDTSWKKPMYKPIPYEPIPVVVKKEEKTKVKLPDKKAIYAIMETTQGTMVLELYDKVAPKTVQNFIDLAQGTKEFISEKGKEKRPFYDGLKFHRVIPNFMAQGGCPRGDGSGGPGYRFEDEINGEALGLDKLKISETPLYQTQFQRMIIEHLNIRNQEEFYSRGKEIQETAKEASSFSVLEVLHRIGYRYNNVLPSRKALRGSLAMANAGPNTNGSQFFINQVDTPHLDGLHTVFGELVEGFDVLDRIIEAGNSNTTIRKVTIIDKRETQE